MSKNGLILLTPTSIAYTGTSATVSANGSVSFSACTSLSLNGVFSADYDNYMVITRLDVSASTGDVRFRLRVGGVDASTSTYTYQYLNADSTTVNAGRGTIDNALYMTGNAAGNWGGVGFIYGPYLAQPTALRTVNASHTGGAGVSIADRANTHSVSISYDGFTLYPSSNTITGIIAVYGMRK